MAAAGRFLLPDVTVPPCRAAHGRMRRQERVPAICSTNRPLRRIAMDFLRDSGAEQEVKSLRSWGSADQGSESLGGHSATGNRRARSCQGAQYLSLAQVRWTSKILMAQYAVEDAVPPSGPPFARLLSEHTELNVLVGPYCYSGTGSSPTLPRGWQGNPVCFFLAVGWIADGNATRSPWAADAMTCWWVLIRRWGCARSK